MTIPNYIGFTNYTPEIPQLYWNVYSNEQRIKSICEELCKIINYADALRIEVNDIRQLVDDIESGHLDPYIVAKIDEWFEENQPQIEEDINTINETLLELRSSIEHESLQRSNADSQLQTNIDDANTRIDNVIENLSPAERSGVQVRTTSTVQEFVDDKQKLVANPLYCATEGEANMTNPLPILYVLNSYRNATTLVYGNDFTATNIRLDGTWEPAINHQDANGKMNIDCTTLVILAAMGILYNASSYTGNANIGHSYFTDMFNENVAKYISYEYDQLNQPVQDRHRRLLSSELAKMLNDRGMLTRIYNPNKNIPNASMTLGALKGQVGIGDILFHSNSSSPIVWNEVGHCSIVVGEVDDNIIICDANLNRGSTPVRYTILTNYDQIKWKWTPIQCNWPTTGVGGYTHHFTTSSTSTSQAFTNPGYCVIYNPVASKPITITFTFPNITAPQTINLTLGQNASYMFVVPGGVQVQIANPNATQLNVKYCLTPFGINPEPYLP